MDALQWSLRVLSSRVGFLNMRCRVTYHLMLWSEWPMPSLMLYCHCLEIHHDFIFEPVFCEWNLIRWWHVHMSRWDMPSLCTLGSLMSHSWCPQNFRPIMCGDLVNLRANLGGSVVKNLPAKAGDTRDVGSIPGSGRSPGVGNSNPLQNSCLGNSIHKEAWQATVHGVAKSQTQLSMTEDEMRANIVLWNCQLL